MANDLENNSQSEVKAIISEENQNKNESNELEENAIINILSYKLGKQRSQDLDIRKIVLDSDGKYLISCSEFGEKEDIKVYIWSIEKILEGLTDPEDIFLKVEHQPNNEQKISNWLLCIDAITTEIKGNQKWIVCAGSIHGDIYVWYGDIDKRRNKWILENYSFKNFKDVMEKEKAVFDIKIKEDLSSKNNTFHLYLALNNIYEIFQESKSDNYIKKLSLVFDEFGKDLKLKDGINHLDFESQEEWILSFDLSVKKKILITGSKDKNIIKWDLETGKTIEKIGSHDDAITTIKLFKDGTRLVSGCLDNVIKVWDLEEKKENRYIPLHKFTEHDGEIVSLDIQKGDEYLVSASKDNTIKIWDLDNGAMINNIDVNLEITKYENNKSQKKQATEEIENIYGLDFLRQVLVSPQNRFIFAVKKNKILIFRNFGKVWHFIQQINHIKGSRLYNNIFGENLRQIAVNSEEREEILGDIYKEIIKKRLTNISELGSLFIPAFIKYEEDIETQREYIASVKTNYDNYWFSAKKLFFQLPKLTWKFKLYLTTDIKEKREHEEYYEISSKKKFLDDEEKEEKPNEILLRDRKQSQIRFLMELVDIPTTFIPLIKAINLDVEDDRGDKDKLIFTDFTYSKNPINSSKGGHIYYSCCIFKLDQRYANEKFADISIRKITVEFTESLNPLLTKDLNPSNREYTELFEAFRNKFQSPIFPTRTRIKIGKRITTVSKMMDNYLSKFVLIEFIFTTIALLLVFLELGSSSIIKVSLYLGGSILMILILFFSIYYDLHRKKRKSSSE